ncbi:YfhO family protein [Butyrivibrio sp. MC2021]|uniref:YfhO family protein n=1 Tax=Butyrivibrio sp. MC2021 TaxID=1408306 RepID=UPI00047DAD3A|nr:YfhO family protein [Butyrivibrio sp. MC2021]
MSDFGFKDYKVSSENVEKKWYVPVIMFASSYVMYILALLPIFISRGLPFFYYGDYNIQQVPFYILAHRAVENGDFFWNWNVDLGGTMFGDFAFYLWGSPFFWITMLFPESAIPYLMPFLMALKYASAATCAYIYIRRYVRKYTNAMMGGYLFAFSGFNACNIVFNHFTDSVAFFPLFLMTFEELMAVDDKAGRGRFRLSGKKFIFFVIMTMYMSVVNYYFFFGQVLFLVIYFCIRYIRGNSFTNVCRMFLRALSGGILGVMIAAFFLLQAFAGIQGNSRLDNFITGYDMLIYPSEKLIWDIVKSVSMLPDIIGKGTLFYTGTVKNASLAAYIPLFGISGVVAFFLLNKKRNWEKSMLILCAVFAFIPVFNASFSMFNSSYYARWYYMPILLMCLMTAQVLERGKSPQLKKGALTAVFMFLMFVVIYLLPSKNDDGKIVFFNMSDNNKIFIRDMIGSAILSLVLILVVFVLPRNKTLKNIEGIEIKRPLIRFRDKIILAAVIVSCILSTFIPVKNGSSIISDRGKEKWQEQMLFNKVEVDQSHFCRGEVDSTSTNYDMVWGIPSIHCFLSTVPSEIFDFLKGSCGITRTVETNLPVNRAGARAILSARYYFENAIISKNRVYSNGEGTDGYYFADNKDDFDIFENLNFIPMGFTFDHYIRESEWKTMKASDHDYDLVRALILPDDVVDKYGNTLMMTEITADYLIDNSLSYNEFAEECRKRAETSCQSFETDTYGFTAMTTMLKDNTLVFFSVPSTEGFSCTVDGQDTPVLKADYGLMAIPVSGGIHEIRVNYEPEGLKAGAALSGLGLIILMVYVAMTLKNIKKND